MATMMYGEPEQAEFQLDPVLEQEAKDHQVVQGLSSRQLALHPEDQQSLDRNASARSRFRASQYLTDEQKQSLIAETFARDADIRRGAMPPPPEALAAQNQTQNNLQQWLSTRPQEQGKPWYWDPKTNAPALPRGWKEPAPQGPAEPPQHQPPPAQPPEPAPGHGQSSFRDIPELGYREEVTSDGHRHRYSLHTGLIDQHFEQAEHQRRELELKERQFKYTQEHPKGAAKPRKPTVVENRAIQADLDAAVTAYKETDIPDPSIHNWFEANTRKPNADEITSFRAKKLKELQKEYLGEEAQPQSDEYSDEETPDEPTPPGQSGSVAVQTAPTNGQAAPAPGQQGAAGRQSPAAQTAPPTTDQQTQMLHEWWAKIPPDTDFQSPPPPLGDGKWHHKPKA